MRLFSENCFSDNVISDQCSITEGDADLGLCIEREIIHTKDMHTEQADTVRVGFSFSIKHSGLSF